MDILLVSILLILGSIGLVGTIERIWRFFIRPEKSAYCYNVLALKGHIDDVEQVLRWFLDTSYNDSFLRCRQFVIIDLGIDDETATLCKCFISNHDEVKIYAPDEFAEQLNDTDVYKTFRYVLY